MSLWTYSIYVCGVCMCICVWCVCVKLVEEEENICVLSFSLPFPFQIQYCKSFHSSNHNIGLWFGLPNGHKAFVPHTIKILDHQQLPIASLSKETWRCVGGDMCTWIFTWRCVGCLCLKWEVAHGNVRPQCTWIRPQCTLQTCTLQTCTLINHIWQRTLF